MSSITLDNNSGGGGGGRTIEESCEFINGADVLGGDDRNQKLKKKVVDDSCSSPSSSIGKNSDVSGSRLSSDGEDSTDEVQSSYKEAGDRGSSLDAMNALEQVLPIRRGISRFYNGKSKSFASLARASSSSLQDLVKPENAYTRKRRNLLASTLAWDKNRSSPLRSNGAGISKRLAHLSRTKLALAVAMNTYETASNTGNEDLKMNMNLISRSSPLNHTVSLSPHLPRDLSALRSFSLADLQCASAATTARIPGSSFREEP